MQCCSLHRRDHAAQLWAAGQALYFTEIIILSSAVVPTTTIYNLLAFQF